MKNIVVDENRPQKKNYKKSFFPRSIFKDNFESKANQNL